MGQEEMLVGSEAFLGSLPVFTSVPFASRKEVALCRRGSMGVGMLS